MERSVFNDPGDIATCLDAVAGEIARVGLEAGPLAPWLYNGLAERGLPVFCIEVRQMKAFGIKTGGGKNTLFARRVREAIDGPILPAMTEPLSQA